MKNTYFVVCIISILIILYYNYKKNLNNTNLNKKEKKHIKGGNERNKLKYGIKYFLYNHFEDNTDIGYIAGACDSWTSTKCGYNYIFQLYSLDSPQIKKNPGEHSFKLTPKDSNKTNIEYGDMFWITMTGSRTNYHILNCKGEDVSISNSDRNTYTDNIDKYNGSLFEIISPFETTGQVMKNDKFILKLKNGKYMGKGAITKVGCSGTTSLKIKYGISAVSELNDKNNMWSLKNTSPNNSELFKIKGKNETIKVNIIDNKLVIQEYDIKYINKDKTLNSDLIHNNLINTICSVPINIDKNDILLEFIPMKNQYSLTIHNGGEFIDYIHCIDLSDLYTSTTNEIEVNKTIKLECKTGSSYDMKYNINNIAESTESDKWIIGSGGLGLGNIMATNYFGTKIKNNFYMSNKFDNLYLKISSKTNTLTEELNPQTVLWSKSYNSQKSNNWGNGDKELIDEMEKRVKNKFLTVANNDPSVIYEFNQPINISQLTFNTSHTRIINKCKFEYFDEETNEYKSLLNMPLNNNRTKNTNKRISAYKFKFSAKMTDVEIYNIFMKGKILNNYPYFSMKKNIGICSLKTKNSSAEKDVLANYITDKFGTWIKVGIFKANAAESIKKNIKTIHNLSLGTDQNEDSYFSADYGEMEPPEVRILGATDFDNWEETRTIDWVYKAPLNTKWKNFFDVIRKTQGSYGFKINGAYDGRGRWENDEMKYVGVANYNFSHKIPGNAYNVGMYGYYIRFGDYYGDNHLFVRAEGGDNGITHGLSSGFGSYDNRQYFFDINYNVEESPHYTKWKNGSYFASGHTNTNWIKQKVRFSSAVWVLLKVDPNDIIKIEDKEKLKKYKKDARKFTADKIAAREEAARVAAKKKAERILRDYIHYNTVGYLRSSSGIRPYMGSCGMSKVCRSYYAIATYRPGRSYVTQSSTWSTWIFRHKRSYGRTAIHFGDEVSIHMKQTNAHLITCGYSTCSGQLAVSAKPGDGYPSINITENWWRIVSPTRKSGHIKKTDEIKLLNLWGGTYYLNVCSYTSDCGSAAFYQVTGTRVGTRDAGHPNSNWTFNTNYT